MKKAILILVVSLFFFLYYMGVLTQKATIPFTKEFFAVESVPPDDQPLAARWNFSPKGASRDPKAPLFSTQELDKIYQLKLDRAIKNVPILTYALVRESQDARRKGDSDQSVRLALYAVKFSPDLYEGYFELAKAHWRQNPFGVGTALTDVFTGLMVQVQYFSSSLNLLYNLFYILANALLMTLMVFAIVVMVKYIPLYFYDIQKNLTQELLQLVINSVKILLFFIPFFLRLDMLWALLFWSILLWGYVTRRERQLIVVFLIVLVYLPFFLRSSSSFLDGASCQVILEMNQANNEDLDRAAERKLRTWVASHPDDSEALFTLGLIEEKQGRYAEAEKFYQSAIQQNPKFSEAYSNLGNIYLARKELDPAIKSYQRAIDLNPTKGAYYYNLYRAHSQVSLVSGNKDQAFQKARQLDPQLIDYHVTIVDTSVRPVPFQRLVIDETLSAGRLWERFWTQFIGREGFLFRLFNAWFEKIPSRIRFLVPVLFLVFLLVMSRQSRAKRFLTRCPMCGSPTHRFYLGASEEEDFICFNCHRIFVQREKLHPKIVEKKALQVRQFEKDNQFISRYVSVFMVGFGHLWRNRFFKGLLLLFVFFIFVMRFIYWNGAVTLSEIQLPPSPWNLLFWGGLFILFYLLSLRQSFRLKSKFSAELRRPVAIAPEEGESD